MLPPVPKDSFTHTAKVFAPVEEVWRALDRPETWEHIGGVDRVFQPDIDHEGRLRGFAFEVVAAGKRYIGRATPLDREHQRLMGWHVDTEEIMGETSVVLASADGFTSITVTLEVESKGLLSTMFFPVIASTIGGGLPRSVDEFAARFNHSA